MNEPVVFTYMKDIPPAPWGRCGAVLPGSSEGCRALFADLLALEYSDPAYGAVNLLAVDAHALQHSEDHGVKNNLFHLLRLCWLLEYGGDSRIGQGPAWLHRRFDGNPDIPILEPPAKRGKVTIADVYGAASPEEHATRIYGWATSVWEAWSTHHEWVRQQLRDIINTRS
ncbi:MAG: DUF5946 family protein [Anaerolineales bacterium]|nr:DUF5946 family protein [Anaerolineales bacterium]